MIVTQNQGSSGGFDPHPEGIYPAVCVDVMELGKMPSTFDGQTKYVEKVKIVFETEEKKSDGTPMTVSKSFTVSLHQKAQLSKYLGQWRGKPVQPGESIDLDKLIGAGCTLVISHSTGSTGKTYANIDAISKATKKLAPSGNYDAALARERFNEWKAKNVPTGQPVATPSKSAAPAKAQPAKPEVDDDVGF